LEFAKFENISDDDMRNGIGQTTIVVFMMEVILNCLLYNYAMTLESLAAAGSLHFFFDIFFKRIGDFKRVHDKKLSMLCIIELMSHLHTLPEDIRARTGEFMTAIVKIFDSYPIALAEREHEAKMQNGLDDDTGVVGGEGENDDYEDLEDEFVCFLKIFF
jgi:hypothetical protein